ncbi:NnrS family protein [Piscinibacter gummiphilus]|uniref:NnrS family protein n=1 Tax=Piscinibacter gummiphilus TaxID=946333 RepID=A0ABZ0CX82_9BURK|nr:NnrS family protein [Piscinibacter gummiphilus]WOB09580.1 NnrS family protein [Piscinibacter gummiphilus]
MTAVLLQLDEPPRPGAAPRGFALWALGFRPFYLLASGFAALSILLWSLQFTGWLPRPYLAGPLWHAHEMVFGFTLAVVVGFLFTAGRNWSGRPTPTGRTLMALAALWLAGRVLVLSPWGLASALVNAAFPLAAAAGLAIPFWRSRNQRNYFFVGLLMLMGLANLILHLSQLGALDLPGWLGVQLALDVVLFIMTVMGGRVIPMFTNNGVPNANAKRHPGVEKLALGSVLVLLVADLLPLPAAAMALIAALAALANGTRLVLWQPRATLRKPLVWVLHLGYAWIVLHLILRAAAALGWVPASMATHALTVGAIGGLVIGMMTRTARGHTARPLKADGADTSAYLLVACAALVRVFLPLAWPAWTLPAIVLSAVFWSAGFGLYALRYWPVLSRPRLDGQPG